MRTLFLALATSATIFATCVTPVAQLASIGIVCKATPMLARAIVGSPATSNVRLPHRAARPTAGQILIS
jgi:hypothetical protein